MPTAADQEIAARADIEPVVTGLPRQPVVALATGNPLDAADTVALAARAVGAAVGQVDKHRAPTLAVGELVNVSPSVENAPGPHRTTSMPPWPSRRSRPAPPSRMSVLASPLSRSRPVPPATSRKPVREKPLELMLSRRAPKCLARAARQDCRPDPFAPERACPAAHAKTLALNETQESGASPDESAVHAREAAAADEAWSPRSAKRSDR
jgi:hypothetical protein